MLEKQRRGILSDPKRFQQVVASCLSSLSKSGDQDPDKGPSSIFCLGKPATISVQNYIERIFRYSSCSSSVFVCMLILLDRLQETNEHLRIRSRNIYRLLIGAITVSAKFYDDFYFKNSYYAKFGGISLRLLNQLESEFLRMIAYQVFISEELYESYISRLEVMAELSPAQDQ